jgi:hypothetical protein
VALNSESSGNRSAAGHRQCDYKISGYHHGILVD